MRLSGLIEMEIEMRRILWIFIVMPILAFPLAKPANALTVRASPAADCSVTRVKGFLWVKKYEVRCAKGAVVYFTKKKLAARRMMMPRAVFAKAVIDGKTSILVARNDRDLRKNFSLNLSFRNWRFHKSWDVVRFIQPLEA